MFVDVVTERLKVRQEMLEAKRQTEEAKQEAGSVSVSPAEDNAELASQQDKTKDVEPVEDAGSQGKRSFLGGKSVSQ